MGCCIKSTNGEEKADIIIDFNFNDKDEPKLYLVNDNSYPVINIYNFSKDKSSSSRKFKNYNANKMDNINI